MVITSIEPLNPWYVAEFPWALRCHPPTSFVFNIVVYVEGCCLQQLREGLCASLHVRPSFLFSFQIHNKD